MPRNGRSRIPILLSFALVAVGLVGLLYGISTVFGGSALIAGLSALVGVVALGAFALRQAGSPPRCWTCAPSAARPSCSAS